MGAWGIGNFDNDTAADWAFDLAGNSDLSLVEETLECVLDCSEEDYLDSHEACEALAAIEVMARLQGNWGEKSSYSEPADNWVEEHPLQVPLDIIQKCIQVIARVLAGNSELNELRKDGDNYFAGKKWSTISKTASQKEIRNQ